MDSNYVYNNYQFYHKFNNEKVCEIINASTP